MSQNSLYIFLHLCGEGGWSTKIPEHMAMGGGFLHICSSERGFMKFFTNRIKVFWYFCTSERGSWIFFNHFLAEFQKKNFLCAVIFWSNYLGPVQKYWDVRCMGVGPNFWPKLQFKFFSTFNFCTQTYWLGPGVPKSQNFEKGHMFRTFAPTFVLWPPDFCRLNYLNRSLNSHPRLLVLHISAIRSPILHMSHIS